MILTRQNAKSLGLVPASDPATDGTILITNDLPIGIDWDFDQENGMVRRSVDFIGLAIHEIGRQLGFFSGVDFLDALGGDGVLPEGPLAEDRLDLDPESLFLTLDLFRYTDDSLSQPNQPHGGLRDFAFGSPAARDVPFFSIDGGASKIGTFSEAFSTAMDFRLVTGNVARASV